MGQGAQHDRAAANLVGKRTTAQQGPTQHRQGCAIKSQLLNECDGRAGFEHQHHARMFHQIGTHTWQIAAAFDAVLTLAYVTLAQNDEAGLLCFSDGIVRWLPPARGRRQLNRMVQAVHDVHPQMVESQFDEAFMHLQRQVRKRTLVVLVTNLIDSQNADRMKAQVTNLVGRHLPLTVLLRDHELFDPVERITVDDLHTVESGKLFRAAAAADILCWRRQVLTDLRHAGVLTLDCFPEDLTAPLINEYMRIKSQHLL